MFSSFLKSFKDFIVFAYYLPVPVFVFCPDKRIYFCFFMAMGGRKERDLFNHLFLMNARLGFGKVFVKRRGMI